ncbi:MAG: hypothetical protein ACRDD2_11175 [Sarcina sp.]
MAITTGTTGAATGVYGTSLANNGKGEILLGGGEVYIMPVGSLTALPSDEQIETADYNVGYCTGGFKLTYKPKETTVYNQLVRTFITQESFTAQTGILTWNLDNIASLSNAKIVENGEEKRVIFTGSGDLEVVILRFVYTKPDGNKIRFTMVGQGGQGFSMDFTDKATSINAEITGIQYFNQFLAEFREEMPVAVPSAN